MFCYLCLNEVNSPNFEDLFGIKGIQGKMENYFFSRLKICTRYHTEEDNIRIAKKYFDLMAENFFPTFTSQCRHVCHLRCFVAISTKFDYCGVCRSSIKNDVPSAVEKIAKTVPFFIILIGEALTAKNIDDARQFLSFMDGLESLKEKLLIEVCETERLDIVDFLLANGNWTSESKQRALFAATLWGREQIVDRLKPGQDLNDPMLRMARYAHSSNKF